MGKASNGKTKSVKPKSDHAARKYETRVVGIDAVAPHPRNTAYHAHPDAQIEMLAQSAQTFGQYKNIVVWKKQIIAGAGIWAGLKKAGATEIEIKDVSHLTQAQAFALMTADNETQKGAVTNDAELAALVREVMDAEGEALARLAAGEQSALERLLAASGKQEETADVGELVDRAAELQKKWKVARGDVWEIESKTVRGKFHRLMCGDSTSKEDVERLMGGERAQGVITDPPWNVNWKYESYKDDLTPEQYKEFSDAWRMNAERVIDSAVFFVAMSMKNYRQFSFWFPMAERIFAECQNFVQHTGGFMQNAFNPFLVWECNRGKLKSAAGMRDYFIAETSNTRNTPDKEISKINTATRWLPTIKYIVENFTLQNSFVYEPFNGSGTTLVACEQTGRIGRGMELEPKYVSVALERLSALGLDPRRVTETEKRNGKQKRA